MGARLPGSVTAARRGDTAALLALVAGAVVIGVSPLLVRLSETGPLATAFWRVALALPVLAAWAAFDRNRRAAVRGENGTLALAGVFFAADLAIWHVSLGMTSVANSTFLVNMAPLLVVFLGWAMFRRRPSAAFALGMLVALGGALLLMRASLAQSGREFAGDLIALGAAFALAGYMMVVAALRARHSTARIMFVGSLACAAALLPPTLLSGERVLPATVSGWGVLLALALVCHAAGQGLIAFSLARLPAAFSSLALLIEPIVAAVLAWALFAEAMTGMELAGAAAILAGIAIARRGATAGHGGGA